MSARTAIRLALVPVLLGWVAACAAPLGGGAREAPAPDGPTVDVAVQNQTSSGAHVYALQEGHMVPVGFVNVGADETLTILSVFVQSGASLQLVVDLVESPDFYRSESLTLGPESRIVLTIREDLDGSTVFVND